MAENGWRDDGVRRALVVGVVGARGGAGASSVASVVARRLARHRTCVLVDLAPAAGGLDVLLGLEGADGVRWSDLAAARGDVPGADVLALLPRWRGCPVLSADRVRAEPPEPAVVADVLHALSGAVDVLVLDLDRSAVHGARSVVRVCDVVLLVTPRDLRSVAGALALRPSLTSSGARVELVVRGPAPGGLDVARLAAAVDLPVASVVGRVRGLDATVERGGLPASGALDRAAERIVRGLPS